MSRDILGLDVHLGFCEVVTLSVPVAMVVVAFVVLVGDVPIAVLAVVLVVVANPTVWFALTERGALRAFGAVAAILPVPPRVVVLASHCTLLWVAAGR